MTQPTIVENGEEEEKLGSTVNFKGRYFLNTHTLTSNSSTEEDNLPRNADISQISSQATQEG